MRDLTDEEFAVLKAAMAAALTRQLAHLATRERMKRVGTTGLDVEYKLGEIARLTGAKDGYPRIASYVASQFTPAQLPILYGLLDDIEEMAPAVSTRRAFNDGLRAVGRHRETATSQGGAGGRR